MATISTRTFRVALTGDFYNQAGKMPFKDMGLAVFDGDPQVEYFPFAEHRPEMGADQVKDANAVVVLAPAVTRASLAEAENLLVVGRFGVGYERSTQLRDGVRFEEVSLGYPKHWRQERGIEGYLREILPG